MDTSREKLIRIGMSDKEARVYLALLELGRSPVSQIAERAEINRSTTYLTLRELRIKGYVSEIPNTKKHEFVAQSPDLLMTNAEERLRTVESIVPLLHARRHQESGLANIRFYQGLTGLREAYHYKLSSLQDTECVAFFGSTILTPEVTKIIEDWYRISKQAKIKVRALAPNTKALEHFRKIDAAHGRSVRVVPHSLFPSELSIEVFPKMVRIIALSDLQTIILEGESVATSFRAIFEMCWGYTEQRA